MIDPTDPCQNPACTRENGRCIGYHCPRCGKPSTSMGHSECHPPSSPPSRAEKQLQDAVTELRRRINAALALIDRDDLELVMANRLADQIRAALQDQSADPKEQS